MIENGLASGISGPKRNQVTRVWRKLRDEEFQNLYNSPNIITIIKLGIITWAEHIGEIRNAYRSFVGKPELKRSLGKLGLHERAVSRVGSQRNADEACGLDSSGSGKGPVTSDSEHNNILRGSTKRCGNP
jgi:hypothetical protein